MIHSIIYNIPNDEYGLTNAQAIVDVDFGNRGKVLNIKMSKECFEAVGYRHSLIVEMEQHFKNVYNAMVKRGEILPHPDQEFMDATRAYNLSL